MLYPRIVAIVLLCLTGVQSVVAQTTPDRQSTNRFELLISPPPSTPTNNTFFISESTNAVAVTIENLDLFTNIVIRAEYGTNVATNAVLFVDTGRPPDQTADDGRFTGNIRTPFFRFDQITLPVRLIVIGEDLTFAGPDPSTSEPVMVTNTFDFSYLVLPRPANDKFTNAFKIQAIGAVSTMTNHFASLETGEPVHANLSTASSSLWWTWSPNSSGKVLIDTAGSSIPAVVSVYSGQSLTNLKHIASSAKDLMNNLPANVVIDAVKGTTYQIAVSAPDASTNNFGNVRLRIAPGATPDTRPPTVSITSPLNGALVSTENLTVSGIARDALINDSGVSNIVLQVNNRALTNAMGSPESWFGFVSLTPGTNVIRAFAIDNAGNAGPADSITIRFFNPTNDLFANAVQLQNTSGIISVNNRLATKEAGEPLHADNEGGHSIWYKWRAPSAGELTLSTSGSTLDTLLGVYTGDALTNLATVISNDDEFIDSGYSAVTLTVSSNQLYFIGVDGFGGKTGPISLQYFFEPVVPGQFFSISINNSTGGSVSPAAGVFPANARVTLTAVPETNYVFANWEGSLSSTENPLTVIMTDHMTLTPRFRLQYFSDDFESGDLSKLPWSGSGNANWFVQTNTALAGKFSARSAAIHDGETTSLIVVTNMGSGTASFDLRLSSESGWDTLQFFLNGAMLQRWSGETNLTYSFPVPRGENRLEWRYSKDENFSSGQDAAFIDNLFIPPDQQGTISTALTMLLFPEGAQLTLRGQPSRTYRIEASSDMMQWTPLESKSSSSGILHVLDRRSRNFKIRFYRAIPE